MSLHDLYGYAVGGLFGFALCTAACIIGASAAEAWRWYRLHNLSIEDDFDDYC